MPSSEHEAPPERVSTPPMAASTLKTGTIRQSLGASVPLSQSELTLPYRRSHPSAASLYASTFSPPGSRSQSPMGRPLSTRTTSSSVFGVNPNNGLALAARSGDSPGDPLNLILRAFVPHVAIYASEDTDNLLKEKGFDDGLWELLRPFGERIQGKVIIRDSNGSSRAYEDYSLRFVPYGHGIAQPGAGGATMRDTPTPRNGMSETQNEPAPIAKAGNAVSEVEAVVDRHLAYAEGSFFGAYHDPLNHGIDVNEPSPYYALYLRRLLSGLPLTPHETFAHPVACVMAISSRNQAPIETLRHLYAETSTGDRRLPNWVDQEYLRYYVLVHDEEKDDITRSVSLFEQMKRNLGLHCHLLRIRGTRSLATDDDSIPLPRCEWMSAAEELAALKKSEDNEVYDDPTKYIFESDATAIRTFIREMVTQSIIPTMERHVSVWNDQVASKRRGLAGKFVGLTRRWGFGSTSKSSGTGSSSGNYDSLGFYRSDTPEAIMRKLADYAFMLRDCKLAYSTYEILRGDFSNDKAWRYHAAANEMAALSLLMTPQNLSSKTRAETVDAMLEAAYYSYLTRCSAPYGAIRSLALGMELLRLRGGSSVDDAARWGVRLLESKVLGPAGDALIKERLAACYASKQGMSSSQGVVWGGRRRKAALWSVLASDAWLAQQRYVQAQQCLNQARKTYDDLAAERELGSGDVDDGNGIGVLKFGYANDFLLGIGRSLNEHLAARMDGVDEDGDGDEADEEDVHGLGGGEGPRGKEKGKGKKERRESKVEEEEEEDVDIEEESGTLGLGGTLRGKRSSALFAAINTGAGGASVLESAPLNSQTGAQTQTQSGSQRGGFVEEGGDGVSGMKDDFG
ncbi:ER-golgi trafficking TRAPP I complex 85 kDa subunit-domain-containing protein [Xylariaceae sp. FL0594]|nr:ER-golgi trafficking TRAPP I complex 85 kDa subunit-domain-containing protein [Xylariaceae sp. FL0594]